MSHQPTKLGALAGIDGSGNVVFWTGRAGDGWVSKDITQAFRSYSYERAIVIAANFNERSRLHGITFRVVEAGDG